MVELRSPHYGGAVDLRNPNDPRTRIVNLVPDGCHALEIGCGSGTIISYLAHAKNCRVLALEPDLTMAAETRALGVEVIQGQVEDDTVQATLAARGPYDAIIFADVLEHLRDPQGILKVVRPWLAEGGAVLVSVPNVAHWSIRLSLLFGRWDYTDGYLMDRTHLRWFTAQTLKQLLADTGYRIVDFQVRWAPLPGDRIWRRLIPCRDRIYERLAAHSPGLWGYQFVVWGEPR